MKAISLTQPWTQLMAHGYKRIETRGWNTTYRGKLLICAAQAFPDKARELCTRYEFRRALEASGWEPGRLILPPPVGRPRDYDLPRGVIVGVGELVDVFQTGGNGEAVRDHLLAKHGLKFTADEAVFGDYSPRRYGFIVVNVQRLATPKPFRGALGIYDAPATVLDSCPLIATTVTL